MKPLEENEEKSVKENYATRITNKLNEYNVQVEGDLHELRLEEGCFSLEDRQTFIDLYQVVSHNKRVYPSSPRFFREEYYHSVQLKNILIRLYIEWLEAFLRKNYLEVNHLPTKQLALISFNKRRS